MTASGLNVLAAIWLLISPSLMGFAGTALATNVYVVAIIIGILALIRFFSPTPNTNWLSWVNIMLGLWLIISPFIFGFLGAGILWNAIIFGIIVAALAIWSSTATAQPMTR